MDYLLEVRESPLLPYSFFLLPSSRQPQCLLALLVCRPGTGCLFVCAADDPLAASRFSQQQLRFVSGGGRRGLAG